MSVARKLAALAASACLATLLCSGPAFAAQVTVSKGDSLWAIANRNGTSVETIQQLNNLTDDKIQPGQVLNVPDQANNQAVRPPAATQNTSRGIVDRAVSVLDFAKKFIGVRYSSGGSSPAGFDCSGYVRYVFGNFGIDLTHSAAAQYSQGTAINRQELRPGDLVFFNTGGAGINHSGIYIGSGKFIHASSSQGIQISSLSDSYWNPRYRGASRIL